MPGGKGNFLDVWPIVKHGILGVRQKGELCKNRLTSLKDLYIV